MSEQLGKQFRSIEGTSELFHPIGFIDEVARISRKDGREPRPELGIGRECYAFSNEEDVAFQVAETAARKILGTLNEGKDYRIIKDPIGNLYIRLFGKMRSASGSGRTVMVGSHLDSVLNGGKYDGVAGVAAGLEILHTLATNQKKPMHDFTVAAFRSEESSPKNATACVGSAIATGNITKEKLNAIKYDDVTLRHYIEAKTPDGFAKWKAIEEQLGNPYITQEDVLAYFETHIEQSGVIEAKGLDIGIVEKGIGGARRDTIKKISSVEGVFPTESVDTKTVPYKRLTLQFTGVSNHTGGTPPNSTFYNKPDLVWYRKDALVASCNAINKLLGHPSSATGVKVLGVRPEQETGFTSVPSEQIVELLVPETGIQAAESLLSKIQKETSEKLGVTMKRQMAPYGRDSASVVSSTIVRRMLNIPQIISVLATKAFNNQRNRVKNEADDRGPAETGTTRATVTDFKLSSDGLSYNLDLREVDGDDLAELITRIEKRTDMSLGSKVHKTISVKPHSKVSEALSQILKDYAAKSDLSFVRMPSMPGHDADRISAMDIPTAMLFIRHDGISHNPGETMSEEDFNKAMQVLRSTVLDILYDNVQINTNHKVAD